MLTQEQETTLKTRLNTMSTAELKAYGQKLLHKDMTTENFFVCDCVLVAIQRRIIEQITTISR